MRQLKKAILRNELKYWIISKMMWLLIYIFFYASYSLFIYDILIKLFN